MLALIGLVLGACSGGDEPSASTDPPTATDAGESADDGASTTSTTAPVGDGGATTTAADVTTTTEPPTVVVPLGVRWETAGPMIDAALLSSPQSLVNVGDDLWLFTSRHNSSVVARSGDAGLTWEQIPVVAPPGSGSQSVSSVVAGPDGRLVAGGAIGSVCQVNLEVEDGYRQVGICERFRPVLYLSDDDGASWRQIEPPAMEPSGNATVLLAGLVPGSAVGGSPADLRRVELG